VSGEVLFDVSTPSPNQRPQQVSGADRQDSKACYTSTAQNTDEHGLGAIVSVMSRSHEIGAQPRRLTP
jgi:hypothetical protein